MMQDVASDQGADGQAVGVKILSVLACNVDTECEGNSNTSKTKRP